MKNADKPIYPITKETLLRTGNGLSKREYFAGIALQGLLAGNSGQSSSHIVKIAVTTADKILDQLEKPNDEQL